MVKIIYTLDCCYKEKCRHCSSGTIKLCCSLINTCIHKLQPLVQTKWGTNSMTWKTQSILCYVTWFKICINFYTWIKMQIARNTYTTLKQCNTNKTKTLNNYIAKILSELKLDISYMYHISDTNKALWQNICVSIWPLYNAMQFKLTLEPSPGNYK